MIHKSHIIPGFSKFIDETVLSHYPPTSMKRILAAGGISLYLKQGDTMINNLLNNPLFMGLGLNTSDGMVDIDILRDVYKEEIRKAGMMRVTLPLIGDVDFTAEDVDTLYNHIKNSSQQPTIIQPSTSTSSGGVY